MFRRFSLYIDIVTTITTYVPILDIIESFTNVFEPITNVSESLEKPNFIYDLLIIDYNKIDFENNALQTIRDSYTNTLVINVPDNESSYSILHKNNITKILREGFFSCELEALIKDYMQLELLTNENTLLDSLFNNAQNSIVITDKKGNIQYANPYFETLSEYKKDELINNSPNVLKSGQHTDLFYKKLWETITHGQVWDGVFINHSKTAQLFYEEATITPLLNSHGFIEKYLKIGKNITREKMLLAELSKEIKVAKKVLKSFLPRHYNDAFINFEYHLSDYYEIGGDFIYFKCASPKKYYYSIIDVIGHGVSSALVALTLSQMFDDHVGYLSLQESVKEINTLLCHINQDDNDDGKYVTGIFMEIDFELGKLKVINAGHPDLILQYKNLTHKFVSSNNIILGILDSELFEVLEIDLKNLKKVITYTDGLYENHNMTLDDALELISGSLATLETTREIEKIFEDNESNKDDATVCILSFTTEIK